MMGRPYQSLGDLKRKQGEVSVIKMCRRILRVILLLLAFTPILFVSGAPENRLGHRMFYDPVGERVMLYGGANWDDGYTFYDDLWEYDYESGFWLEVQTSSKPDGRFNAMVTYIPERHGLFMFGGFSHRDRVADTWLLDLETMVWTELHPIDSPSPRSDSSIAYDQDNDVVVLFSGYREDETKTQETWVYSFDGNNWVRRIPDNTPLHQYGHYMVYAPETGQLLMYPGHWSIVSDGQMVNHGFGGNIWEYDSGANRWTEHESPSVPPGRYWSNVAYDSNRNRVVLFGGNGARDFDDTWAYDIDTGEWEQASGDTRPAKRGSSNMAYDPEHDVFVMFGGHDTTGSSLGDTWILDADTLTWSTASSTTTSEDSTVIPAPISEDSTDTFIPGFPVWTTLGTILLVVTYWTRKHR